jgi:prepilin-type N-terminal cleavage/methylation domain-containing protein
VPLRNARQQGFTLIELSIVLVIIGLIVGGVLVGQDLIRAAEARATISQIEKYNTAVNTFRGKYNALPGDLNAAVAIQFGFASRGGSPAQGDGNGIIEGCCTTGTLPDGYMQSGETLSFWADLTVGNAGTPMNVNLIDGSFSAYPAPWASPPNLTATNAASYLPEAKLGKSNFVYVYSTAGINYFGIGEMSTTSAYPNAISANLSVQQAYQIDKKIDDGFPITGNVTATYDSGNGTPSGSIENAAPPTVNAAATDSATSCYNSSTQTGAYSLNINNGTGVNCALSFRFQ